MAITKNNMDWIIHYVNNHDCELCGKMDFPFLPYICDAHTHGLVNYGHLEFQVVLDVGPNLIGFLLNAMGCRVQNGESFKDGDIITGIVSGPLRLKEVSSNGERVLRIMLPDEQMRFPGEADCMAPYNLQDLSEEFLRGAEETQ